MESSKHWTLDIEHEQAIPNGFEEFKEESTPINRIFNSNQALGIIHFYISKIYI